MPTNRIVKPADTQSLRNFIHFTLPLFDFIVYAVRCAASEECFWVISLWINKVERKQEPSKRANQKQRFIVASLDFLISF